jgi:hypothetical protein
MSDNLKQSNWVDSATEAVAYLDASLAKQTLDDWIKFTGQDPTKEQQDKKIERLRRDLMFVGFAFIDDELAYQVLNRYFIEYLKSVSYLSDPLDRIRDRIQVAGYSFYDEERERLKKALVENGEKLGPISISSWIRQYEAYNQTAAEDGVARFILQDSQANTLDKQAQSILRTILSLYDDWLSRNVFSIFDIAYIQSHPELLTQTGPRSTQSGPYASEAANVAYQAGRTTSQSQGKGVVRLPLLKALSEYPRLGEQQITTEKIRVKSSPELVRPNLANWIRYYRDELGIGFHDQVTRGKFLFQSENGKKLGNDERERINLVLKSLEEEFPLDIDTDRMVIVFPVATPPMVPQGRGLQDQSHPRSRTMTQPSKLSFPTPPQAAPARPVKPFVPNDKQRPTPNAQQPVTSNQVAPKTAFFGAKFGAAKNVAGETLHFSTGHVLPSEKSGSPPTPPPANLPTSASSVVATPSFRSAGISQSRGTALPRSPYSIRPLRMREDTNHEAEAR